MCTGADTDPDCKGDYGRAVGRRGQFCEADALAILEDVSWVRENFDLIHASLSVSGI